ncbi:Botulinum neurotoxin type E, partial [Bienertia sinuspersici]
IAMARSSRNKSSSKKKNCSQSQARGIRNTIKHGNDGKSPECNITVILNDDAPDTPMQGYAPEPKGSNGRNFSEWLNTIPQQHPINSLQSMEMSTELPTQHNSQCVEECVKIEIEDIQHEIDYWSSSLYVFVLGANPPTSVIDGFIRRVWKEHAVDKAWSHESDMDLDNIMTVPVWVHVHAHYKTKVNSTKAVWQQKRVQPEKQVDARIAETGKNEWIVVTSKNKKSPADNNPCNQEVDEQVSQGKKPFKYFSMWLNAPDYKERITRAWNKGITGTLMFQVVQKLREVKKELKELNNKSFNGIQAKTEAAYTVLINAQTALHQDPGNADLAKIEHEAAMDYNKKNKCFNQFLKQKAKIRWIQEGDANTRLFHRSLKAQRAKSNIYAIQDQNGTNCNTPSQIANAFSQFYKQPMGRYVWALATKQDNLWVKWIHAIYLKDSSWTDYYPKPDVSCKQILQEIIQWLGARPTATNIPLLYRWINRRIKASKFQKEVWSAAINATTYHIWQQHNNRIWREQSQEWGQVVKQIKAQIIMRLNGCNEKKKISSEKHWIDKLYS